MSGKTLRDTVGFLGVIASLLFVGLEIQQNNRLAQAAAYQAIGIASTAAWDSQAHDREFVALQEMDPADMDAIDWRQWYNKFSVFARLAETTWLQVEQGLLPEDAMERLGFSGWRDIFDPSAPNYGGPKVACVWPLIRPVVSPSFRQFVEEGADPTAIDCSGFAVPVAAIPGGA